MQTIGLLQKITRQKTMALHWQYSCACRTERNMHVKWPSVQRNEQQGWSRVCGQRMPGMRAEEAMNAEQRCHCREDAAEPILYIYTWCAGGC